jgi:hypothetical protein
MLGVEPEQVHQKYSTGVKCYTKIIKELLQIEVRSCHLRAYGLKLQLNISFLSIIGLIWKHVL